MQNDTTRRAGTDIPRIRPIGRLARIVGAIIMTLFALDWLEAGMTWFGESSTPANLSVWLVTGLAVFYGLHQLPESGFGKPWGRRTVAVSGVAFAFAAVAAISLNDGLWAPPLTTLLFWFDVGFLIAVAISYLVAVFLGTPGCEVGGLGELIRRLRGVPDPADHEAMWCIAGIHHLDQWEADRTRAKMR
jgi:hypothetical protein